MSVDMYYPLDVDFNDAYYYHAVVDPGDGGGYYMVQVQTGTVHHDAVYTTVHHDAETTVVHHDATGHYETVVTQAAWDETVTNWIQMLWLRCYKVNH